MTLSTFDKLHARFDAQAAGDMDAVFQFHFDDADSHYLVVRDATLTIEAGEHPAPSVTLATDTDTLRGVMSGEINGMAAVMSGRLKASGNIMLAPRLASLFPRR